MSTTIMAHVSPDEEVRCAINEMRTGSHALAITSVDHYGIRISDVTMFFKNEESLRQAMYAIRQAIDNYECQLDGLDYMDYEREPF